MSETKAPAMRARKVKPVAKAALTPPAPGQFWEEQKAFYAGVVCQPDGTAWHLLLPKGTKFSAKVLAWGEYGQDVKGATSVYDGLANTAAMLEAGSPAAKHAKTLGDDVYLPSRAEALLLFATLKEQFDDGYWHWTSSQSSEYGAWDQGFGNGTQNYLGKGSERRCRFVRRLVIQSFNPLD